MAFSPAGLWTPPQTAGVAATLTQAYAAAPKKARKFGGAFYPEWRATAEHIGQHIGRSAAHGATLLAQLSPANEAELNRIQAMGLVHGDVMEKASQITHIHQAARHETLARSAGSSAFQAGKKGDTQSQSRFMEEHAKHSAEVERHRRLAGVGRGANPLSGIGSGFLSKAVHVREGTGGTASDPLATLGDVKIGDFGRMIHDPEGYHRPPIDTHYHDAALRRYDIPYQGPGSERGLTTKSRYEGFQGAHAAAHSMVAEELGVEPTHAAMMGTIWYGHQMEKAIRNPNSLKARKASETKVANIRRDSRFKSWMPESHGLAPSFAKIET